MERYSLLQFGAHACSKCVPCDFSCHISRDIDSTYSSILTKLICWMQFETVFQYFDIHQRTTFQIWIICNLCDVQFFFYMIHLWENTSSIWASYKFMVTLIRCVPTFNSSDGFSIDPSAKFHRNISINFWSTLHQIAKSVWCFSPITFIYFCILCLIMKCNLQNRLPDETSWDIQALYSCKVCSGRQL